jgi:hypothetical protein
MQRDGLARKLPLALGAVSQAAAGLFGLLTHGFSSLHVDGAVVAGAAPAFGGDELPGAHCERLTKGVELSLLVLGRRRKAGCA